ncbi:MAG TPA: DUF4105 domain-containing protein, partial [Polyangiaceae bacterium]
MIALAVPARAETAQPPSITLLTMGPGDQAFSKFGHIAIWVRDPESQREEVFNYGTFRFDSPWLILDFLKGNLRYWLSVDTPAHTLAVYRRERRTVLAQELALGPEESRALLAFLRNNALPENRYYRYDYYYDNCSTRIRDVLDRASHGAIRAAGQAMVGRSVIADAPGRLTFRGHTARLVAENFPLYAALDIVMGPLIDQPITQWEETFLPAELARLARKAEVPTLSGPVPLVTREYEVVTSDRPLPRDTPPRWAWRFGAVGAAAAAIMATLAAIRSRATRALFAVFAAVSGLVC